MENDHTRPAATNYHRELGEPHDVVSHHIGERISHRIDAALMTAKPD